MYKLLAIALIFLLPVNAFSWTKTATFESGTVGNVASGTSGFDYAGSATVYSTGQVYSGTKSTAITYTAGDEGWTKAHGEMYYSSSVTNGGNIWMRAYFWFPNSWNWSADPVVKIMRIARVTTSSGGHIGWLSILANSEGDIVLSNEIADVQTSTGVTFTKGAWQSIEIQIRFSTSTPIFRIWKNGVLIANNTTNRTIDATTNIAEEAYLHSNWNGGSPATQTSYMDDIVMTTDTPSNVDSSGNPMIGPADWTGGGGGGTTTGTPISLSSPINFGAGTTRLN